MDALDGTVSWEVETYISLSPSYPVCTHVNFRVHYSELAVLTNVGI